MDFPRSYLQALLAKEIDAAAELQEQKSRVVSQQYCTGSTLPRGCHCPSPTYDLWCGNTKRGRRMRIAISIRLHGRRSKNISWMIFRPGAHCRCRIKI